jgi:Domain of unknown function (DUF5107)
LVARLDVGSVVLRTAPLGPCSPLPMLGPLVSIDHIAGDVPADIASRARDGTPPTLLPYLAQDDYGRRLEPRQHRVAVLESDRLRATVALDLGGRLLSLYDRRADRELLYVNPVMQPANLALRNAWCSGGVEWNIGTRGHSPTTMDTLHAARVEGPDGEPMLRLWEWERIRGVVFQVDLWIPRSSTVLLAHIRIRNLNDTATPMYWWTNAAVTVLPDTRVLAPATRAFRTEYPSSLGVVDIPGDDDVTFPLRHVQAADFFFDIRPGQRPWIAAIDGDGSGVAHVSTSQLGGRKLFVWGTGRGGQRWQDWLSHGGDEIYAEIQAGLAPTQFEHVSMPGRAIWSWTEAFGAVDVDAARSHCWRWADAAGHVGAAIDDVVPAGRLDAWHGTVEGVADRTPAELLATGSGWGALERRRRQVVGMDWIDDSGTPFPDASLGLEQEPWLELVSTGRLPPLPPECPPASYVVGGDWEARLGAAPPTWLTEYLGAVLAHGRGDRQRAIALYESSLRRDANAWALRGLAEISRADGRLSQAVEYAVAAARMASSEWRLAAEAVSRLLDAGRPDEALTLLDDLPADVRNHNRLKLLEAWAAHGAGDVSRALAIVQVGLEVADLREGERSLDELWGAVFPGRAVPKKYDFRMVVDPDQRSVASED